MSHAISNAQLCKLLEEVMKADLDYEATGKAVTQAQIERNHSCTRRNKAHEAALKYMQKERGLIIHDGYAWRVQGCRIVSEPIGRNLEPHQESLLPQQACA